MVNREDFIFSVKLAEECGRYDDMTSLIASFSACFKELTSEERNLLSAAYKNSIGARKIAWRVSSSLIAKNDDPIAKIFRNEIEMEIKKICLDAVSVLEEHLIKNAITKESKIFYYNLKAFVYRYMCEFSSNSERKEAVDKCLHTFKEAQALAAQLSPANPIRLNLSLNFSIFYYEIFNSIDKACRMSKIDFDEALGELHNLDQNDESYKDATLVMQLIRDNLTLWTSDIHGEHNDDILIMNLASYHQ